MEKHENSLNKIKEYTSEEREDAINDYFEKYYQEIDNNKKRNERYVDKLHSLYGTNIDVIIEKIINKYDSKEYRNREYKMGYEPREDLYWLLLSYAEKYGKPCNERKYYNMFTSEAFFIGSYVIQAMDGQGSVVHIDKIRSTKKAETPEILRKNIEEEINILVDDLKTIKNAKKLTIGGVFEDKLELNIGLDDEYQVLTKRYIESLKKHIRKELLPLRKKLKDNIT